jgi:hypothetical protein
MPCPTPEALHARCLADRTGNVRPGLDRRETGSDANGSGEEEVEAYAEEEASEEDDGEGESLEERKGGEGKVASAEEVGVVRGQKDGKVEDEPAHNGLEQAVADVAEATDIWGERDALCSAIPPDTPRRDKEVEGPV